MKTPGPGAWTGASKRYICECGYSGWFPKLVQSEEKKDGLTEIVFVKSCKKCGSEKIKWDEYLS